MHAKLRGWVGLILVLALSATLAPKTRADEAADTVVNPQYLAWAAFKLGSSATHIMDIKSSAGNVHMEITSVLKSVDDNVITLDMKVVRTIGGKAQPVSNNVSKYPHMMKKANLHQLADQDVTANGKKYACKVYEVASGTVGGNSQAGGKSTVYLSEEVPGGVVKMQLPSTSGPPLIMTLSEFKVQPADK